MTLAKGECGRGKSGHKLGDNYHKYGSWYVMQTFKSVYFPDHPSVDPKKRHLRLAFGPREAPLYNRVSGLSSTELRGLLGVGWPHLVAEASRLGVSLNKFCLSRLQSAAGPDGVREQLALPGYSLDWRLATYAGGRGEPLHEWYPYLESYSPGFVEYILDHVVAGTQSVLDPFAGSGVTPLTVARRGQDAWYCEVNPLLQYLVDVKASALSATEKQRNAVAALLQDLGARLPQTLRGVQGSADLRSSYRPSFGESDFFDSETFEHVLQCRAAIDEVSCAHKLAGDLMTVAALAALVPASLLQRAGDLRYKTADELARKKVSFVPTVQANIRRIAGDLAQLTAITHVPSLVCGDARRLEAVPSLEVDAVITSPPYLNGTNYVRNTKVELWFLRALKSSPDLASLRLQTVTAGICDVSRAKVPTESHPSVSKVVEVLAKRAYDRRIPEMVSAYFADVTAVYAAISRHVRPGGRIVIDIGDSVYAGVHVATDELLVECLRAIGYAHLSTSVLRKRRSRGGMALRQVLLVFEQRKPTAHRRELARDRTTWARFKTELPHQRPPFSARNWGHPLHSLCSFQGKLKPSLARFLVDAFVPEGGTVLDPFGGVGTIPFESALTGRKSFSFEISPAAYVIGLAKVGRGDPHRCFDVIRDLERYIASNSPTNAEREAAYSISFNKSLPEYFHSRTLDEILVARRFFAGRTFVDAGEALVFASLLHIMHGNRPYALSRRSHPITPFAPTGKSEYRALIPRLREKVTRSLDAPLPENFVSGEAFLQDATGSWPNAVRDLDAVITSPPFYDSTRFYLANWMRLWMAGWDKRDFEVRPQGFVDERQKKDFAVYRPIFRQARERLKPTGVLVMHLGRSWKCDMAAKLAEIALPWFRVIDRFDESVEHCESHGIRDKGTVSAHQYLVLG